MRTRPHVIAAGLLAGTLATLACGSPAPAGKSAPPADQVSIAAAELQARPLQLPVVPPGAGCPAAPQATLPPPPGVRNAAPGSGFGTGPAYLAGQLGWYAGAPGQVALVLVDSRYSGPLLVRARRVDGNGTATLSTMPDQSGGKIHNTLAPGTAAVDGVAVDVPRPAVAGEMSTWVGRLTLDTPGCYALQVDGAGFTSVIVFAVQAGPIPPG